MTRRQAGDLAINAQQRIDNAHNFRVIGFQTKGNQTLGKPDILHRAVWSNPPLIRTNFS